VRLTSLIYKTTKQEKLTSFYLIKTNGNLGVTKSISDLTAV